MKNSLIALSLAVTLASGSAFAGAEPAIPGVSVPLTSVVVIPPPASDVGTPVDGGIPVFFIVTPPTSPGGFFTFRLVSNPS